MTREEYDERVAMIDEARELVAQAVDLTKEAIRDTQIESNVKAYLLAGLEVTIEAGGWLSRDQNFTDVAEVLLEEVEE